MSRIRKASAGYKLQALGTGRLRKLRKPQLRKKGFNWTTRPTQPYHPVSKNTFHLAFDDLMSTVLDGWTRGINWLGCMSIQACLLGLTLRMRVFLLFMLYYFFAWPVCPFCSSISGNNWKEGLIDWFVEWVSEWSVWSMSLLGLKLNC